MGGDVSTFDCLSPAFAFVKFCKLLWDATMRAVQCFHWELCARLGRRSSGAPVALGLLALCLCCLSVQPQCHTDQSASRLEGSICQTYLSNRLLNGSKFLDPVPLVASKREKSQKRFIKLDLLYWVLVDFF